MSREKVAPTRMGGGLSCDPGEAFHNAVFSKAAVWMRSLVLFSLVLFGLNIREADAQCTAMTNGQWPSTTYNPTCAGTAESITTGGYGGEYSAVNLISGISYTFASSVGTDIITIASSLTNTTTLGTVVTFGTGSVTYTAASTATYYFGTSLSGCAAASVSRTRSVTCTFPPCAAPTAQPTAFTNGAIGQISIAASFTAASPAAGAYLVVRYATGATPTSPVNGTTYTAGGTLGTGTIVQASATTSFTATGLTVNTAYDFYIYSYNSPGCTGGPVYRTASPLTSTVSTLPAVTVTATAQGGLWSSPATWVGGSVPASGAGNSVVIPAGSVVTVDQIISYKDYTINGVMYWNGTANAMSASGNVTIGATGRFLPYTTAGAGVQVFCLGDFTNNGYANLYLTTMIFTGSGSQALNGSGTYQTNGTKAVLGTIQKQNTGTVTVGFACNVRTLNPLNGTIAGGSNIEQDFTKSQIWGQSNFNSQVVQAVVTTMGAGYAAAPSVGPSGAALWVATTAVTVGAIRVANGQVYTCSVAGTTGATAPSHTSGTATDGTATWLWVGAAGSVGTAVTTTALTAGTQYFYGNNLYTCTVAGTPSAAAPPTHTSGTAASGTATFQYVGSAAKISVNYDATNLVVRSANITTAGSGYVSSPTAVIVPLAAPTTAASITLLAYHRLTVASTGNTTLQKSGAASVTGISGANIAGNGSVSLSASNGGRYTAAPAVGISAPNAINLAHLSGFSTGSGYTLAPTAAFTGGTLISGTAAVTPVLANGKVIAITLGTGTYSVPPTGITFTGGTFTTAASTNATFTTQLANRWASFTSTLTNGQITGFTTVSAGSDYTTATVALTAAGVGEVAATVDAKVALHNISLSNFTPTAAPAGVDWTTPATQAGAVNDEASNFAGYIPSSRKINALTVGAGSGQLSLTGSLTLLAAATAITLSSGAVDLGGNDLIFQNGGYAGANSASGSWVQNGRIQLNAVAAGTRSFPFRATGATGALIINTGTGTGPIGGSDITQIRASVAASAPSGTAAASSSFTGSIATTNLTVTVGSGIVPGMTISGSGVTSGTVILSQTSGVSGGAGVYVVSVSQTVASTGITGSAVNMTGSRAYQVDVITGSRFGTATTFHSATVAWDASDNLVSNNQSIVLCQSNTGLSSGWAVRGPASAAGTLAATGTRLSTTATATTATTTAVATTGTTLTITLANTSIAVGMEVAGTGIPAGTVVSSVTSSTVFVVNTAVNMPASTALSFFALRPIQFASTMYFGIGRSAGFVAPSALNFVVSRTTGNAYNSIMPSSLGGDGTGVTYTSSPGWDLASTSNDDNVSGIVTIPSSTFTYQGSVVTGFRASTNGNLQLQNSLAAPSSTTFTNQLSTLNNILAVFWEDLTTNPNSGGTAQLDLCMRYKIGSGSPGTRKIIAEWYKMTQYGNAGPELYFQIVLDENDNSITYNYGNMQMFNGTVNLRYTYSMGLNGGFISPWPQVGEIFANQYENSTAFSQFNVTSSNLAANALCMSPAPRSSYKFTPGSYVAPVPFDPVVTAPSNDNVGGAVSITPLTSFPSNIAWNTVESPNRSNIFTLRAATQSPQPICAGPSNAKDVWFKFNANDPNIQVRIYPSGGMTPVIEVLDASLNPLAPASCNVGTIEGSVALTTSLTGLNVGDDYYVRVYNSKTGTTASFSALVGGGTVIAPVSNSGGTNYPTLTTAPGPLMRVTGGGGNGAVFSITNTGGVLSLSLTNGGLGYTSAPTITIDSPDWGYTGEFGIIVYAKPGNDDCAGAFMMANPGAGAKVGAVSLSGGSVTNGSTTLTVSSTTALGAVGSQWVISGPLVDVNTIGTVASATTITLSAAATGTASGLAFIARQNTYSAVTTGAATASIVGPCPSFPTANPDDDVWYQFVATSTEHSISVVGKGGFDAAITVLVAGCTSATLDCFNATGANGTELANLTGLSIGNTYLFRVYDAGTGSPIGSSFEVTVFKPLELQYQFSQSNGTYSPITGGTVLGSGTIDNAVYKVIAGANKFKFNTIDFDSAFVSANGFVMLNERPDPSTLYPLNIAGGSGAMAAFAADLTDAAGAAEIRYQYVAPNHIFQWSGMRRSGSTGESINFQVRMNATTGDVNYVYGAATAGTNTNVTVCGIRTDQNSNPANGTINLALASPTGNFKKVFVMNRTTLGSPTAQTWASTTTGTSLTSAVGTTASSFPTSGLTLTYSASSCNPYTLVSTLIGSLDKADPYTIKWRKQTGSQGYVLRYRKSTLDNLSYTSINVGSVDTDTSYTFASNTFTGSTYYLWDVLSVCGASATQKSHASNTGIFSTKGDPIAYDFAVSSGTYTPITGGTVLHTGTIDDAWANHTPTSSFFINDAEFTDASVNSNGYLVGGTLTLSAATYSPLASLLGLGLVSPMGEDLYGSATGEVRYEDVGAEHVWQWKDWTYYIGSGSLNFQARYNKSTKAWKFVYGANTFARSTDSAYVGIRAGSNVGRREVLALTNRLIPTAGNAADWTKLYTANSGTANAGGASWPNTTDLLTSGMTVTFSPISCGGLTMAKMPVTLTGAGETATVITKNAANAVKWYRAINADNSAAANGYYIRYRDVDDPETVATWATPIATGSGPNDTTYSFTGLKPGATVVYQTAGRCSSSNRTVFGGLGRFTTLPPDYDIEFTAIVGPEGTSCFSATTPVTARITNNGLLAVAVGQVFNYTINVTTPGGPQTLTGSYTTTAALAPAATIDISVGTLNMATAGSYTFATGNMAWGIDEKTNNNDLFAPYSVTSYAIATAPASYAVDAAQAGAGFVAVTGANTPSYATTMSFPTLTPQQGTGMVYWNSFSITSGNVGRFVTPCIQIPTNCYEMKFFHSRDNGYSTVAADEGTKVRVSTDGGLTWSAPKTLINVATGKDTGYVRRYYAPATTAGWYEFSLNLGEYNGQNIKVAFDMTSRVGNNMAIDNIRFAARPITNDISYESVVSPEPFTSCGTSSVPIVVRVRNKGCVSYSNIPVTLLVSGAATQTINNVIPGPLDGSQYIDFTVGTVNMVNPGNYIYDGNIVVSGDQVSTNNNLPNTTIALIAPPQLTMSIGNANAIVPATTTLNGTALVGAPTVAFSNSNNVNVVDGTGTCLGAGTGTAGAVASSTITVGATVSANTIQKVTVNITHAFCEDLRLRLQAPNGSIVELVQSCDASGSNYIGTSFVASGGASFSSSTGPYAGEFAPFQPLSGFTGSANGTWTLLVSDHYSIGTGSINNWSVQFVNQLSIASWTCPTCPIGFPQNFTAPISSVTPSPNVLGSSWSAGSYDITLAATDLLGCANTKDTTFNLFSTNVWLGINDGANNWSDAANWIASPAPPTATQEITIPSGTPFPPKANATVIAGTVNLNAGSVINIASGGNLNVYSNIQGTGGTTIGDGAVNLVGTGAQYISGNTNFNNLTVTKTTGATNIAGITRINGTLTMANATSSITVPPTGKLILASGPTGTGRIGVVPAGATINGNVTMERYLPFASGASGQWFLLSSPITGKNFTDWVDDFKVYGPASAYGSQGGGIISIGAQHSTILNYNEVLNNDSTDQVQFNGWRAPNGNIANGVGYRVFVDKYSNGGTSRFDNEGTVKTGIANFPLLSRTVNTACTPSTFICDLTRTGWNLLGNPYPSSIDWDAASGWTKPGNLQAGFWRYNGTLGYGSYVTGIGWIGASPAPSNPSVIPSSQGFFVRLATGTSGNMIATESVKTATSSTYLRTSTSTPSKLKISLNKPELNGSYYYSGVVRFMDEASDGFDPMLDFSNLASQNFFFSFPVENSQLMVNSMGALNEQKIVPMTTNFMGSSGTYSFTFNDLSTFQPGVEIYLRDKYFNTIQNVVENAEIAFEVNSSTMSMSDRFELVFNPVAVTGVKGLGQGQFFGLHPNPSNGNSRVTLAVSGVSDEEAVVTVVDMVGKVVFSGNMNLSGSNLNEKEFDFGLPSGVYTVRFNSRRNSFMEKMVIR